MGSLNILNVYRRLVTYKYLSIFCRRFLPSVICYSGGILEPICHQEQRATLTIHSRVVPNTWLTYPDYFLFLLTIIPGSVSPLSHTVC